VSSEIACDVVAEGEDFEFLAEAELSLAIEGRHEDLVRPDPTTGQHPAPAHALDPAIEPRALRNVAAAVVQRAVEDALAPARNASERRDRDDALRFLLDPEDRRLEQWTSILEVDADALRDGLRRRLRALHGEAFDGAS